MNVLVIAAHPDDEVLGCGGTIAKLCGQGHHVFIATLGEGVASRGDCRDNDLQKQIDALQCQSAQAGRILGADEVVSYQLPDNRFDSVPLLEIVKIIEVLIDRFRPDCVYTQHGGDLNVDHVQTFRATLTATRPGSPCAVRELYAYEVGSSTEWSFQRFEPAFRPNVFIDVSATLEQKIKAIQAYESEVRTFPHPRSAEALRAAAARWGSVAGCPAAEAFELVRSLPTVGA